MKLSMSTVLTGFMLLSAAPVLAASRLLTLPIPVTLYSQPYSMGEESFAALTDLKEAGVKLKLTPFVPSRPEDEPSTWCRGWFPVVPQQDVTYKEFVFGALQYELTSAGLYSETEGLELTLQTQLVDFNSQFKGKWIYKAVVTVQGRQQPLQLSYEFPFEVSMGAVYACKEVSDAFVPSVRGFLKTIYTDARFRELVLPAK